MPLDSGAPQVPMLSAASKAPEQLTGHGAAQLESERSSVDE